MGEVVRLVLQVLNLPLERWNFRSVGESLLEKSSGVNECCSLLLKEVVEAPLAGDERAFYSVSQDFSETAGSPRGWSMFAVDWVPPLSLTSCSSSLCCRPSSVLQHSNRTIATDAPESRSGASHQGSIILLLIRRSCDSLLDILRKRFEYS